MHVFVYIMPVVAIQHEGERTPHTEKGKVERKGKHGIIDRCTCLQ